MIKFKDILLENAANLDQIIKLFNRSNNRWKSIDLQIQKYKDGVLLSISDLKGKNATMDFIIDNI